MARKQSQFSDCQFHLASILICLQIDQFAKTFHLMHNKELERFLRSYFFFVIGIQLIQQYRSCQSQFGEERDWYPFYQIVCNCYKLCLQPKKPHQQSSQVLWWRAQTNRDFSYNRCGFLFWEKYSRLSLAKVALRNPHQMQYKASFTFWIGFFFICYILYSLKNSAKQIFFRIKKTGKGTLIMQDIFRQSDVCPISEKKFL